MTPEQKQICDQSITIIEEREAKLSAALDQCCDDSYATKIDLRNEASSVRFLTNVLKNAVEKDLDAIDFSRQITDYGYDHEAAASDRSCGIEYVSESKQAEGRYESSIYSIESIIAALEQVGLPVRVGVEFVLPEEHVWKDDNGLWMDDYGLVRNVEITNILAAGDLRVVSGFLMDNYNQEIIEINNEKIIGVSGDDDEWLFVIVNDEMLDQINQGLCDLRIPFLQNSAVILAGHQLPCELGVFHIHHDSLGYNIDIVPEGVRTISSAYQIR